MKLSQLIREKAKKNPKIIVLPEGEEPRMIKAAETIINEGFASLILLGREESIKSKAQELRVELPNEIKIINPKDSKKLKEYAESYYQIRKNKGISSDEAYQLLENPLYFGALMVYHDDADGLVAGSINATGDVFRPALQTIKTAPGINIVSSSFVMVVPDCPYGEKGIMVFADCALNPEPNAEQLADVAIASAATGKALVGFEPRVAMLSFSTKGSGKHPLVDKITEATKIAKEKKPELLIDGELQADAALIPSIGERKAPNSKIAGKANVLIFPDLNSGNIAYKLIERLAKAEAIGPISQGMRKPVNDLSRGCSAGDIVNVVAITVLQAG
ncbi:MAG TPA: phosphate acetyltransferase [Candidatus Atribacteria bacterium]|nr:MAG: Phosphate acetyltransferase [Atribacteria bacterium 34_128]HAJ31914.1 phosphate acetyltransferase [Candidatus Atribacteria bacterium]